MLRNSKFKKVVKKSHGDRYQRSLVLINSIWKIGFVLHIQWEFTYGEITKPNQTHLTSSKNHISIVKTLCRGIKLKEVILNLFLNRWNDLHLIFAVLWISAWISQAGQACQQPDNCQKSNLHNIILLFWFRQETSEQNRSRCDLFENFVGSLEIITSEQIDFKTKSQRLSYLLAIIRKKTLQTSVF